MQSGTADTRKAYYYKNLCLAPDAGLIMILPPTINDEKNHLETLISLTYSHDVLQFFCLCPHLLLDDKYEEDEEALEDVGCIQ